MDPKEPVAGEGEDHEMEALGLSPELLGELMRGAVLTRELLGPETLRITPELLRVVGVIELFFPFWRQQHESSGEVSTPIDINFLEENENAELIIQAKDLGTAAEYERAKQFLE